MDGQNWLWWIVFLPLVGSAVCGVLHFMELAARRRDSAHAAHAPSHSAHASSLSPWASLAPLVASSAIAASFALAIVGFRTLSSLAPDERVLLSTPWSWIDAGSLSIDVAMHLDPLSSVMTLVITGVGLLIHIYAAGYMKGDPGYAKFFAYLNLFVFAMLILVLSSSLLGLFIGWEGVGLCSYLLIGFWYEKGWPAEAGQKAFVMNRIGDACFLIGTFLLVKTLGSLDLAEIARNAPHAIGGQASIARDLGLAALLLFFGACGKSAQIPLFTWLPDAMAGPTPVSALIHAATMVTAGVYLVVRLNPLFASFPELSWFIGCVGAVTAFVAGSTALVQRDIKKVLAYSTVSQLGYMFLGLAAGAYSSAIFHLVTHAFFKALLFLGAGSVIHGMHEEQDMHKMGGLRKHMPRTFATFVCGAAALSGLPLLSGFFSKDEILAHVYARGGMYLPLWFAGIVTAAMTAFYTWRMVALTFFGAERFDPHHVHPHESPPVMTAPLMVLAVLAVVGGVIGLPAVFHATSWIHGWLEPVLAPGEAILAERMGEAEISHSLEWILLAAGASIALYFAHAGFHAYKTGPEPDRSLARANPKLWSFLENAWRIDLAYTHFVVQPLKLAGFVIAVVVDQFAIDGLVNGTAVLARATAMRARKMANGNIASYGLWMGAVTVVIAFFFLWRS